MNVETSTCNVVEILEVLIAQTEKAPQNREVYEDVSTQ